MIDTALLIAGALAARMYFGASDPREGELRALADVLYRRIEWPWALGDGPTSLFKPGGTAFVVHAQADDYTSEPAGASGDRVACGVVSKP